MPKVCVMSSVHISTDTRIYQKEIISLAKAGYEVVFLNKDCTKIDEHGVRFKKIETPRLRFKRMLLSSILFFLKALKEKADIYHFHDSELLFAGLFLSILRKKVIYDVHEDVPRDIMEKKYIKPYLRKSLATIFEVFEKSCAKSFAAIIVSGPALKDIFVEKKCYRVVSVTNYPKLDEFTSSDFRRLGVENAVCYIGELEEFRGIYEMLEAIAISKGSLEIGGRFNDETYKSKCLNSRGWKKVNFHGYVNREEVVSIMKSSIGGMITLLPNPRHNDSMPNKMYEYMAAGIPVIASNFPYWRNIIESGDCGICVDPTNSKDIAKAIDFLIDNPMQRKIWGENGRKLTLIKYNWSVEEKKLLNLYEFLLRKDKKT